MRTAVDDGARRRGQGVALERSPDVGGAGAEAVVAVGSGADSVGSGAGSVAGALVDGPDGLGDVGVGVAEVGVGSGVLGVGSGVLGVGLPDPVPDGEDEVGGDDGEDGVAERVLALIHI
ncbi:hypothetical protein [Micrococcus sp. R8502A1]|uniref:hypothetical protein n=1 Tax=Micrococcus sp. R8502A1 TaxID=2583239 RepID=UPI0015EEF4DC|nr:hypothetical protein [Micrococcus sp. R8502A1]